MMRPAAGLDRDHGRCKFLEERHHVHTNSQGHDASNLGLRPHPKTAGLLLHRSAPSPASWALLQARAGRELLALAIRLDWGTTVPMLGWTMAWPSGFAGYCVVQAAVNTTLLVFAAIAGNPQTIMWSTHSRRIEPINRSAKAFCQGEAGAIGLYGQIPTLARRGMAKRCRQAARRVSICLPSRTDRHFSSPTISK
jgi:hypothetical protein